MGYAFLIFAIALVGGFLSLGFRWTERLLHLALAFSTGIFLGAVFLHLLPSLSALQASLDAPVAETVTAPEVILHGPGDRGPAPTGEVEARAVDHHHGVGPGGTTLWSFVLLGVLSVYIVEALILRAHDHGDLHQHRAVGYAALTGLSFHSITEGLSLGVMTREAEVAASLLLAVASHKAFATFSLATVLQLAELSRRTIGKIVVGFSTITPMGIALGRAFSGGLSPTGLGVVTALAAGTFLFVALCELLPEVFHHHSDKLWKLALLGCGIGLTVGLHGAGA